MNETIDPSKLSPMSVIVAPSYEKRFFQISLTAKTNTTIQYVSRWPVSYN